MVNYSYYANVYFGYKVKDGQQFNQLSKKSERLLSSYTFGRIYDEQGEHLEELIKMTICELIDNFFIIDNIDEISQETVSGYKVTYRDNIPQVKDEYELIENNLGTTGLLYIGR